MLGIRGGRDGRRKRGELRAEERPSCGWGGGISGFGAP